MAAVIGSLPAPGFQELFTNISSKFNPAESEDVVQSLKRNYGGKFKTLDNQDLLSTLQLLLKHGFVSDNKLTLIEEFVAPRSKQEEQIKEMIKSFKGSQRQQVDPDKELPGRQDDIKKITKKLETKGQSLVVNLFGSAGVGKTTLARKVCSKWQGEYFVCDLREAKDMIAIYLNMMSSLGLTFPIGYVDQNSVVTSIHEKIHLLHQPVLFLLDNVEQFTAGQGKEGKSLKAAFVQFLVRLSEFDDKDKKTSLKLLLTSRTQLQDAKKVDNFEVKPLESSLSEEILISTGMVNVNTHQKNELINISKGIPLLLKGLAAILRQERKAADDLIAGIEKGKDATPKKLKLKEDAKEGTFNLEEEGVDIGQFSTIREMFNSLPTDSLKVSAVSISLFCGPFSAATAAKILGLSQSEALVLLEGLVTSAIIFVVNEEAKEVMYDIHPLLKKYADSIKDDENFHMAYLEAKGRFHQHFMARMKKIAKLIEADYVRACRLFETDRANYEFTLELSMQSDYFSVPGEFHENASIASLLNAMLTEEKQIKLFHSWAEMCEDDGQSVPQEIQAQGHRAEVAFKEAMEKGSVEVYRGRIMLIGQDRAGKTSLKKFLLGIPFDPEEESTVGIKVDPTKFEVEIDQVKNWQVTDHMKLDLSEYREDIAKITVDHMKASEVKSQETTDRTDLEQELNDPSRLRDVNVLPRIEKDAEGFEQSDASPTIDESVPDSNQGSKGEIDPSTSNVQQNDMPADQDAQLTIDTTAGLTLDDVTEKVEQCLQGLELNDDVKAKEVILSVWDFAGQDLYYTSHSVFLSHKAVYVLVYNLSKDLSAQAEPSAKQGTVNIVLENPANQTNLDNLLSWLVSVHCIRPTTDEVESRVREEKSLPYLRPPVFVVGTHADKPFKTDIGDTEKHIKESISGKTYAKHVIRPFFAVDNTRSVSDYGIQALQNRISEVLKQEPYMGEKVPIRWFHFEKVIEALVAKEIYHMELKKLEPIIKRCCGIDDKVELKTMLKFYHDLGVIVKHGQTVVLQALWLIDLFKQLITVRPFDEMTPRYSDCWKELEDSGILRMELVDHVFADFIQKGLCKQDILNMMELYGLVAKFSFLPADDKHQQKYFVPAQLRSLPSGLYEVKPSNCDPCPLYLHFLDGFVPHGLFAQLLSRCIVWCSGCNPKRAPDLYQNGARFFIGKQPIFDLVLISRKRFIKVLLRRHRQASAFSTTDSAAKAREVRAFIEDTLKVMSRELSWLRNLQYELCVACPHCLESPDQCSKHGSVRCPDDDCLRLLPLLPEEQLICPMNFGVEPIRICGLEKWLLIDENEIFPDDGVAAVSQGVPKHQDRVPLTTLKVTILGDELGSSAGGLSTLNKELAIHLAEQPDVEVTFLLPEGSCTDEHKKTVESYGINVVEAKRRLGYDRHDWLSFPPPDLSIDVVIGHGMKLGRQGQVLKCRKWVQVVHTAPEQLGMFKNSPNAVSNASLKHETEVGLCKLADLVVPVGPKLAEAYSSYLRSKEAQDTFVLTPGLFKEFADLKRDPNDSSEFKVLLCGRADSKDFKLKGYDIGAEAFADEELKGKPYRLLFVGAPDGEEDEVARKLLQHGIAKEQLTVRKFVQSRDKMKELFCEVDLAIMPSRTEGFGLIALEALSAGLPILVSSNSGFARALQNLHSDKLCIVDSKEPKDWAKAIKAVRERHGEELQEIQALRESYGEKYSWEKQCKDLVEKIRNIP